MPLPEQFLMELVARNDIESVVSSYVNLKSRGRTKVGLCPFHGEKTASFTVYPDTSSFYCFGCGAGGDVITFIKKIENLDYLDAVKFLADRAGLTMPEDTSTNDAVSKLRVRILEANREAARFFHEKLYSEEGKEALKYFHDRKYTDNTIRHFGLGYAPNDFHALQNHLRAKGFRDDEMIAAFLCKKGQNGGAYDVFRNRVMIPIIDIRGNVIAFGGRVLDDSKPKYVNTSDTLPFKKSRNLFALNFAKANAADELILCEGYMDVIAMHQAGFTNAVAALGTSFTEEHANLLARYTKSVVLLFDSDGAGQKAAKRAIDILRPTGLNIRVVSVPDGKDPDEFIKKNGADRFKLILKRSSSDTEYKLLDLAKQYDLKSDAGKSEYLSAAAKLLATLDKIEADVYAGTLARDMQVQKSSILAQVDSYRRHHETTQTKHQVREIVRKESKEMMSVNPKAKLYPRAVSAEENLIGLLLLHPDYFKAITGKLQPNYFATDFNRSLYERILKRFEDNLIMELPYLAEYYEENEMAYITKMQHNAQLLAGTVDEVKQFADVLIEEYQKRDMAELDTSSDEDVLKFIQNLREQKEGK